MIGERLGNYRIISQIGEGGMGVVYLAEHEHLRRHAAVKVLHRELGQSHDALERLMAEARSTALIRHPGIVEILDCGFHVGGEAYIVMEYLEGCSLGQCLRQAGRLPLADILLVARQIAAAVGAAHEHRVVHRDLKAENVFLMARRLDQIKVLDFGIAKLLTDTPGSNRTKTGLVLGTPSYMSPEQCRGTGEIDHRSDIYSLGCVLYEMACGRLPFTYAGTGELLVAHLGETPRPPRVFDPTVAPELETLLLRMLSKSPSDRPASMHELIRELDRLAATAPAMGIARSPEWPPAFASAPLPTVSPGGSPTHRLGPFPDVGRIPVARRGLDTTRAQGAGTTRRWGGWVALVAVALVAAGGLYAVRARKDQGAGTAPVATTTPEGQGQVQAQGQGQVQAQGQGLAQPEGQGLAQPEGQGLAQPEGLDAKPIAEDQPLPDQILPRLGKPTQPVQPSKATTDGDRTRPEDRARPDDRARPEAVTKVALAAIVRKPPFAHNPRTFPPVSGDDDKAERLNGFVDCLNSVSSRARDSFARYRSWVKDLATGPTGKESIVYGLYTLSGVESCHEHIDGHASGPAAVERAAAAYDGAMAALDRVTKSADSYYESEDHKDDAFARGRRLHGQILAAFNQFSEADTRLRQLLQPHATKSARSAAGNGSLLGRKDDLVQAAEEVMQIAEKAKDRAQVAPRIEAYAQALDRAKKAGDTGGAGEGIDSWQPFLSEADDFLVAAKQRARRIGDGDNFSQSERSLLTGSGGWMVNGSPADLERKYGRLIDAARDVKLR